MARTPDACSDLLALGPKRGAGKAELVADPLDERKAVRESTRRSGGGKSTQTPLLGRVRWTLTSKNDPSNAAHGPPTGGQGVAGSNPVVPTVFTSGSAGNGGPAGCVRATRDGGVMAVGPAACDAGGIEPQIAPDLGTEQGHSTTGQLVECQITVHTQSVGAQPRYVAAREVRRTQRGVIEFHRRVETAIDQGEWDLDRGVLQLKPPGYVRTDQLQSWHRPRPWRWGLQQEGGNNLGRDFLGHGAFGRGGCQIERLAVAYCLPQALRGPIPMGRW